MRLCSFGRRCHARFPVSFFVVLLAVLLMVLLAGLVPGYAAADVSTGDVPTGGVSTGGAASGTVHPDNAPSGGVFTGGNATKSPSESEGGRFGDLTGGVFWGHGRMTVDRQVAVSPSPLVFASGFTHRADTNLDDPYLSVEWRARLGNVLLATTSVDTNLPVRNQFKQTSSGARTGSPYNSAMLSILSLPANTTGVIDRDSKNSLWNVSESLTFPDLPYLRLGWKYHSISSDISSYAAAVPAAVFPTLPGLSGWENGWADATHPSTTGFAMAQRSWWTGPFLGARFEAGSAQELPGRWYVEAKVAPYVWGTYTFDWSGYYHDATTGDSITGQESTHAVKLHGCWAGIKGGLQVNLTDSLVLDFFASFEHLQMSGAGVEGQATQNNIGVIPFWLNAANYSQHTAQSIRLRENFLSVGPSLVLHF